MCFFRGGGIKDGITPISEGSQLPYHEGIQAAYGGGAGLRSRTETSQQRAPTCQSQEMATLGLDPSGPVQPSEDWRPI